MADLKDVLTDDTLEWDGWTLPENVLPCLKVAGWSGRRKGDKVYVLHCSVCARDPELFGEGYFKSLKFSLTRDKPQTPCGCASRVSWTERQYEVLCKRKLIRLGLKFKGWAEPYKKAETRVRIECPIHGEWVGTRAGAIAIQTTDKGNCKKCGDLSGAETRRLELSHFTDSFMRSGMFETGTTFEYMGYSDGGTKRLWNVSCTRCGDSFESNTASLQAGKVGCSCSWGNQKQAYINNVFSGEELLGLKFGISVNAKTRSKGINNKTDFTVQLSSVYQFDTSGACKSAEKYCKKVLPCMIFSQELLPDGYTETTYPHYYNNITEIYEKMGGKLVDIE